MSYLAERGGIVDNDEGSYLVMLEGYVQQYDNEGDEKEVQIVADQNMLDLTEFGQRIALEKGMRPREAYMSDLFRPDMTKPEIQRNYPQLQAELHPVARRRRSILSSSPLSPLPVSAMPGLPPDRTAGGRFWRPAVSRSDCAWRVSPWAASLSPWAILLALRPSTKSDYRYGLGGPR